MRWRKRGLVFSPDGRYEWMQSHAQNPSVLVLDDRLRVYFTCRPAKRPGEAISAFTTFVELSREDPGTVLYVHDRPLLPFGGVGAFDQFGIMPGCVLPAADEVRMYYVGWMRTEGAPFSHAIGLALSHDGGTAFDKVGAGPVLTRTVREPFLQNSPYVIELEGLFHMWYSSGIEWREHDGRLESIYVIMRATSTDGVTWARDGVPCVPVRVEHECQTGPCVVPVGDRYYMWFCYRHGVAFRNAQRGYRIGFAWSDDLLTWHRHDELGELPVSDDGWDSEMVCYPEIVRDGETTYMFYSGNDFGRVGFGYAVLK
jgi:hypothetical protein